jgi:hypothetical protein
MDGSDAIRKPWLTPHSHSNSGKRTNVNDARAATLAARALN